MTDASQKGLGDGRSLWSCGTTEGKLCRHPDDSLHMTICSREYSCFQRNGSLAPKRVRKARRWPLWTSSCFWPLGGGQCDINYEHHQSGSYLHGCLVDIIVLILNHEGLDLYLNMARSTYWLIHLSLSAYIVNIARLYALPSLQILIQLATQKNSATVLLHDRSLRIQIRTRLRRTNGGGMGWMRC